MEELTKTWNSLTLSDCEGSNFRIKEEQVKTKYILVAKLLTKRALNIDAIVKTFTPLWRSRNGFKIKKESDHVVLFSFDDKNEMEKVMAAEPWSFDKRLMVLQRYGKEKDVGDMEFNKMTFWVQVHDLSIRFRTKKIAEQLCEAIGKSQQYGPWLKAAPFVSSRKYVVKVPGIFTSKTRSGDGKHEAATEKPRGAKAAPVVVVQSGKQTPAIIRLEKESITPEIIRLEKESFGVPNEGNIEPVFQEVYKHESRQSTEERIMEDVIEQQAGLAVEKESEKSFEEVMGEIDKEISNSDHRSTAPIIITAPIHNSDHRSTAPIVITAPIHSSDHRSTTPIVITAPIHSFDHRSTAPIVITAPIPPITDSQLRSSSQLRPSETHELRSFR
uniref:DUF4283 domain-containing protein n=1 Tax=Quercus lobata TaxID=97700 RepID=A0A7N2MT91_QUELO